MFIDAISKRQFPFSISSASRESIRCRYGNEVHTRRKYSSKLGNVMFSTSNDYECTKLGNLRERILIQSLPSTKMFAVSVARMATVKLPGTESRIAIQASEVNLDLHLPKSDNSKVFEE